MIIQVPSEARLTASGLNCGGVQSLGKCQFTWGSQQVANDLCSLRRYKKLEQSNVNLGSQCTTDSVAAVVCEPESRSACGQVGFKLNIKLMTDRRKHVSSFQYILSLMTDNPGCNCLLGVVL